MYLKAEIYVHCLQTVEKLKETIREEIVRTPYGMLARMIKHFWERLNMYVALQGYHFNNIIFEKYL